MKKIVAVYFSGCVIFNTIKISRHFSLSLFLLIDLLENPGGGYRGYCNVYSTTSEGRGQEDNGNFTLRVDFILFFFSFL